MLSENIKVLRKQKGYSQEQLADKLNVVRQTVSKWEKGYSVPDADMLEELADIFEVQVSELLGKEILTEEETTDMGELVKQLTILNEYIAEKIRKKKKAKRIFKRICTVILIIAISFVLYLCGGVLISQGQEIFRGETEITMDCSMESEEYHVVIRHWNLGDEIHSVKWSDNMPKAVHKILRKGELLDRKPDEVVTEIETYFTENGGTCEIEYESLNSIDKIKELIKTEISLYL